MPSVPFENAPLVEMIAEVRWDVFPIPSLPNGALDPLYETIKKHLSERFPKDGISTIEELVPREVPREFLAGQVTTRFRSAPNAWPIFQLGPGVFSVNITTAYTGWQSFRPSLEQGLQALINAHPAASSMLRIKTVKLIAVDGFTLKHGYENYRDFTEKYLKLGAVLPSDFSKSFAADTSQVVVQSQTTFPLNAPAGAVANVAIAEGIIESNKALVVQTFIEQNQAFAPDVATLVGWFDAAHETHRSMFRGMLTAELIEVLKPRTQT